MTDIDAAFAAARAEGVAAFARWMALVERPLRASLRRFARAVDVESAMQETLLRMWILVRDGARPIEGENGSLRFALRVARIVALEEVRRARLQHLVAFEDLDPASEPSADPVPPEDPGLMRAIKDGLERLRGKPREALFARLAQGHGSADRDLAATLGMAVNTFLQNVVRARRSVADCLERKGA